MRKSFGIAAALIAAILFSTSTAGAQDAPWAGPYLGVQGTYLNFDVDWENPGTPEQSIDGVLAGINAGFLIQGNAPFVAGIAADLNFGNLVDFQRDGNYIVEHGVVHATGSVRGVIGIGGDRFLAYATGGIAWARMTQGQSCPNPSAVVAGWCGPHGPYDLTATGFLWGPVFGGGVELRVGRGNASIFAEVLRANFRPHNFVMGPDGDGHPTLPDQIVVGASTTVQLGFRIRF